MVYLKTSEKMAPKKPVCPTCKGTVVLHQHGKIICTNDGTVIYDPYAGKSKKSLRTHSKDGYKHDSVFEASVADELLKRVQTGDIKEFDSSYRVDIPLYDQHGKVALIVHHKIDYRIHHNDGSFELVESKGRETEDWKYRRRMLEIFWLPFNKDHTYTVRTMGYRNKKKGRV